MRAARWAVLVAAVSLVVAVAAVAYAAGKAKAVPVAQVVRARRFELVDERGRVRAELAFSSGWGDGLILRDVTGKVTAKLSLGGSGAGSLFMQSADSGGRGGMTVVAPGFVSLVGGQPAKGIDLAGGSVTLSEIVPGEGPKSRAVLGEVALEGVRSGDVEQRSLSSLVLFDKEGKVLWRAP